MDKILPLRTALYRLCFGGYTDKDIQYVVEEFFTRTKQFLFHRESRHWRFRGEWKDGVSEIDDLTLDFISPLFARDGNGIFIELQAYFSNIEEISHQELQQQIDRLLNSVIQQQAVYLFRQRDPFGRIFYRSLRYILHKRPEWKREVNNGKQLVRKINTRDKLAPKSIIEEIFLTKETESSLTSLIETCLEELINVNQFAVPIAELLSLARELNEIALDSIPEQSAELVDPLLVESVRRIIEMTLAHIDQTVLDKYEKSGKLTSGERTGFRDALKKVLFDFANGGIEDNYFTYLSSHIADLNDMKQYRNKFRTQFEYMVKKAKQSFSARIKNDLSI